MGSIRNMIVLYFYPVLKRLDSSKINSNYPPTGSMKSTVSVSKKIDTLLVKHLITLLSTVFGQDVIVLKADGCNINVMFNCILNKYCHVFQIEKIYSLRVFQTGR